MATRLRARQVNEDTLEDKDGDTKVQVEESSDEDKIRFDTAGSERMIIDAEGKVGIGTSSPASELDVGGKISFDESAFGAAFAFGGVTKYGIRELNDVLWRADLRAADNLAAVGDTGTKIYYPLNLHGETTSNVSSSTSIRSLTDASAASAGIALGSAGASSDEFDATTEWVEMPTLSGASLTSPPTRTDLPSQFFDGFWSNRIDLKHSTTHKFVINMRTFKDFPASALSYGEGSIYIGFFNDYVNFKSIKVETFHLQSSVYNTTGRWVQRDTTITSISDSRNISRTSGYGVFEINFPAANFNSRPVINQRTGEVMDSTAARQLDNYVSAIRVTIEAGDLPLSEGQTAVEYYQANSNSVPGAQRCSLSDIALFFNRRQSGIPTSFFNKFDEMTTLPGGISFGNGSDSVDVRGLARPSAELDITGNLVVTGSQVKVTSAGPTSLFLEADTNDTTETDTAYIKMTQDGGKVTSYVGHSPANDQDPETNTVTDAYANSLLVLSDWHYSANPGQNSRVQLGSRDYDGNMGIALTVGPGGSSNAGPHVGIKTISPKKDLQVGGDGATIRLGSDGQDTDQYNSVLEFCEVSNGPGDMTFGVSMNFDATNNYFHINRHSNDTTGVNVMTILRDSSKIGIGTTTPLTELDVSGDVTVSGQITADKVGIGTTTPSAELDITGDVTVSGEITAATQPAFLARKPSNNQDSFAIDTGVDVTLGTEDFDVGSNFASNTFTAPTTGVYIFTANVYLTNLDVDATSYSLDLVTDAGTYRLAIVDPGGFSADVGEYTLNGSMPLLLTAGDTAKIQVYQAGGSQQTSIRGSGTKGTFFAGYLLG